MVKSCPVGKGDQTSLNGFYQHYKGGVYQVIGVAFHSETLQEMVVYCNQDGILWTRPKEMFLGKTSEGIERFQKL